MAQHPHMMTLWQGGLRAALPPYLGVFHPSTNEGYEYVFYILIRYTINYLFTKRYVRLRKNQKSRKKLYIPNFPKFFPSSPLLPEHKFPYRFSDIY